MFGMRRQAHLFATHLGLLSDDGTVQACRQHLQCTVEMLLARAAWWHRHGATRTDRQTEQACAGRTSTMSMAAVEPAWLLGRGKGRGANRLGMPNWTWTECAGRSGAT